MPTDVIILGMNPEKKSIRFLAETALVAGSLAITLAACGASQESSPSASSYPSATSSAPGSSSKILPNPAEVNGKCADIQVEVDSGGRFKRSNSADIQKQIDALAAAYNDAPVTIDIVLNALSLVTNASVDPMYASAMSDEQNRLARGAAPLSAQELLDKGYAGADCLTDGQIKIVDDLFGAVMPGLGHKIGSQTSADVKGLYYSLKVDYQTFKKSYLPPTESTSP